MSRQTWKATACSVAASGGWKVGSAITFEEECRAYRDRITLGLISREEFEHIMYVRKAGDYPPRRTAEWERWATLICRFHALFPDTLDRDAWHEAGHIVVGHKLGWTVQRIERNAGGWPQARVEAPCEGPELPGLQVGMMTIAGFVAEAMSRPEGEMTDPTHEVAEHAIEFRSEDGDTLSSEDRIKYIKIAQSRACDILAANWDVVERVAALEVASLPVEREALLEALEDVEQDDPPCGPQAGGSAVQRSSTRLRQTEQH
jgi:hypothetical protein